MIVGHVNDNAGYCGEALRNQSCEQTILFAIYLFDKSGVNTDITEGVKSTRFDV